MIASTILVSLAMSVYSVTGTLSPGELDRTKGFLKSEDRRVRISDTNLGFATSYRENDDGFSGVFLEAANTQTGVGAAGARYVKEPVRRLEDLGASALEQMAQNEIAPIPNVVPSCKPCCVQEIKPCATATAVIIPEATATATATAVVAVDDHEEEASIVVEDDEDDLYSTTSTSKTSSGAHFTNASYKILAGLAACFAVTLFI